ncbi:MAG TPA: hypothetical protein VGK74_16505 [Symbiobacteriaceae bacterium]
MGVKLKERWVDDPERARVAREHVAALLVHRAMEKLRLPAGSAEPVTGVG